ITFRVDNFAQIQWVKSILKKTRSRLSIYYKSQSAILDISNPTHKWLMPPLIHPQKTPKIQYLDLSTTLKILLLKFRMLALAVQRVSGMA
ncbi:MAG: hypothetical protein KBT41_03560, partial [bacterium]|nr:hypothetical protein [Candidatus Colousia faecequi]